MPLQTFHRGVRQTKIANWNGVASYGTAYTILGSRNADLALTYETDTLRGDDVDLDQFAKLVAATLTLDMAAVDLEGLSILVGGTLTQTADYYDWLPSEDDIPPYVAVAVRVAGTTSQGDLHMFIPKAKLSGDFNFQAQLDSYVIPQINMRGVFEGSVNQIVRMRNFLSATALEIPLRTTTGGL